MNHIEFIKTFQPFFNPDAPDVRCVSGVTVPVLRGKFWDKRTDRVSSLHSIPYRACFSALLPRLFINGLTKPNDIVFDPFMGRGTTLLEACMLDRKAWGCDINPTNLTLVGSRLMLPDMEEVFWLLDRALALDFEADFDETLLSFFHQETLRELCKVRDYIKHGGIGDAEAWIYTCITSRLTGNSPGYLSTYTMPGSQAVTPKAQARINRNEMRIPEYRSVRKIVEGKSNQLLSNITNPEVENLTRVGWLSQLRCCSANQISEQFRLGEVALTVTSPPFLDIVDYKTDNWLRGWFSGVDTSKLNIWQIKSVDEWTAKMTEVMNNLRDITKTGGYVLMEVGEVRDGTVLLEENVLQAGIAAGLKPLIVLIHEDTFAKQSSLYGVSSNEKGTNTHRMCLFIKE